MTQAPIGRTNPEAWKMASSFGLNEQMLTDQRLETVKEAGLSWIELSWRNEKFDMFEPENERLCAALIARAQELGIGVWTMHLPFGTAWDVSLLDPQALQEAIARHVKLLQLAHKWGIRTTVLHPSWEPIPAEERDARMAACKMALPILAEEAEKLGIRIAVECLPRTCLGNTSAEMLELMQADERLGICCDVNHLLKEKPEHFIREVGSRIITVHISDYDGLDEKHWMPGEGINDWNAIVGALAGVGYEGPFMFEVRNPDFRQLADCWSGLLARYQTAASSGSGVV